MGRLAYSPYELRSAAPLGALSRSAVRHGALLRIEFAGGAVGYADLHPWTELGDLPLSEQLARLTRGETTDLTRASLAFAALDADSRAAGRSVWDGLTVPASHFLLSGVADGDRAALEGALAEGFTRFKVKVGRDLDAEKRRLMGLIPFLEGLPVAGEAPKLRPDYNETLTPCQFAEYFAGLEPLLPFLDFVEDPYPFEAQSWSKLSAESGVCFALDRAASSPAPDFSGVIVHKPARTGPVLPPSLGLSSRRLIVTSYLDHPLGQLGATWVAAQLPPGAEAEIHGLVSHRVYARTRFSEHLGWHGPRLCLPGGHGLGFDEELAATDWKALT